MCLNKSVSQLEVICSCAGHLPLKLHEYKKKFRPLASTYVTFRQDGNELLVNLGGEQIYLFDVNAARQPRNFQVPEFMAHTNGLVKSRAVFTLLRCDDSIYAINSNALIAV